jgi:hypothetical protein
MVVSCRPHGPTGRSSPPRHRPPPLDTEIDPRGDVVLILRFPNSQVFSWPDGQKGWGKGKNGKKEKNRKKGKKGKNTPPRRAVAARLGSLKREAIEAELRVERAVKRRAIDLGCEIPFTRLPRIVEEGFTALAKVFSRGNAGIREHYHAARNCLQECLGDPLCDLNREYGHRVRLIFLAE